MDLLGMLNKTSSLLELVGGGPSSDEPWASDAEAFLRHFGVPYEDYLEITKKLSDKQAKLLHATLEVNPEAAVLWILAMDEIEK